MSNQSKSKTRNYDPHGFYVKLEPSESKWLRENVELGDRSNFIRKAVSEAIEKLV